MQIKFKELNLKSFKSHQEITVNFGERTVIVGDNHQGKSSIGEAISWLLYGIDTFGSKLDPEPVTYESDGTKVDLLIELPEKEVLLSRELKKGRTKYFINEVPGKAGEYDEVVKHLFESKEFFLSLYNPKYFFTQHWEKQREMLLSYVPEPGSKQILAALPGAQSEKLAALMKKHNLDDLNKLYRDSKTTKDKDYIRMQERVKTLKEEMEQYKQLVPLPSLRTEKNQLEKKRNEKEKIIDNAADENHEIRKITMQIDSLTSQIDRGKETYKRLKEREIETTCFSCGQELTDEAKNKAQNALDDEVKEVATQVNPLIQQRKELREKLAKTTFVEVDDNLRAEVREIQNKINDIDMEINKHVQVEQLEKRIEEAELKEKELLEELNEAIFIVDSIKDYHAKQAELQADKVQSLFETLSVRLFKEQKNGDIKPTFEIQMDGKDYSKLSLSESIRAGLELREVLSEQSKIIAPVFVDNSESITKFKEPSGQLIMAKVVAGQELKIEGDK
ncbi:AAA family ATPase [Gracilibacillus marinus]|uniref:Nuclease SbcCD subunit C n=1 Tax=Gracilibacillus marinus TaxID=630535 RepID=A0ABV8VSP2_9BACI